MNVFLVGIETYMCVLIEMIMMTQKTVGKMTLKEAYPYLMSIAKYYGLNISRVKDFKTARMILVNLYNREIV